MLLLVTSREEIFGLNYLLLFLIIKFLGVFFGDFNVILGALEHLGASSLARLPIQDFQDWTDIDGLLHLDTIGAYYTRSNGILGSANTPRRLGKAICNMDWFSTFNQTSCCSLTKVRFDHFPLLLNFNNFVSSNACQFKFQRMWIVHPLCLNVVKSSCTLKVSSCPMFVLSKKLKFLKNNLKIWNKETFGNVHHLVSDAEDELNLVQAKIRYDGYSDNLRTGEKDRMNKLKEALHKEHLF